MAILIQSVKRLFTQTAGVTSAVEYSAHGL